MWTSTCVETNTVHTGTEQENTNTQKSHIARHVVYNNQHSVIGGDVKCASLVPTHTHAHTYLEPVWQTAQQLDFD